MFFSSKLILETFFFLNLGINECIRQTSNLPQILELNIFNSICCFSLSQNSAIYTLNIFISNVK